MRGILFLHELRQGKGNLLIWTATIGFLLAVCIFLYPEIEGQMGQVSGMFADMGSFSAAFGMDKVDFGQFMGYFAVECGNILGLGGGFFAALLGISSLAKEEGAQTAEFLLSHPVSRRQVVLQKLLAVLAEILVMNGVVMALSFLSALAIGAEPDWHTFGLLFLAYLLLQMEIGAICFGISAFLSRGGMGIGLGIAALLYFLNLIANLTEKAEFLKYITPYSYADGAEIVAADSLEPAYLTVGLCFVLAGIGAAFYWYERKDVGLG
ncbi:MAG: ABC transporter permease subunit [Firmicutes bacterium]|nr:ABC transporter permease subunit [Bacillota bacterium]